MNVSVALWWLRARLGLRDDTGANLVEYILLLALIALVVVVAVEFFGTSVKTQFGTAGSSVNR